MGVRRHFVSALLMKGDVQLSLVQSTPRQLEGKLTLEQRKQSIWKVDGLTEQGKEARRIELLSPDASFG